MHRATPVILLLLALSATHAHAVPITTYATGLVTEDRTIQPAGNWLHSFTVGSRFWAEIIVEEDVRPEYPFPARIAIQLLDETGWRKTLRTDNLAPGVSERVGNSIRLLHSAGSIELALAGPVGWLTYTRDAGAGTEAFRGSLEEIDASAMPIPEPGGLALGMVGSGLLGLASLRRRRAA